MVFKKDSVAIISYDVGHLKAVKIVHNLILRNKNITIFSVPFKKRKIKKNYYKFQDRPNPILLNFDFNQFCKVNKINIVNLNSWEEKDSKKKLDNFLKKNPKTVFLTCISKIIPEWFIKNNIILNAHPGILPLARGLDSFKWSIIKKIPLGVTLHIIDKNIDCGKVIKKSFLPIYSNDNLTDVVSRSFEMECSLLSNYDFFLKKKHKFEKISNSSHYFSFRIPQRYEKKLNNLFEINKKKFISYSCNKLKYNG